MEQTQLGFLLIGRNQYCMKCSASVFPVDYYFSPPQTADITHNHLANPWCEPQPDPFPAPLAGVRAALSSRRPLWPVMYLRGAAFLWGWPGSNDSDFPNSPEMGGLTSSDLLLICSNHCRQERLNVSLRTDLRGRCGTFLKMSSSGLQTQVISAFLCALRVSEANMQVRSLLWASKSKGTNGRIRYSIGALWTFVVCLDCGVCHGAAMNTIQAKKVKHDPANF